MNHYASRTARDKLVDVGNSPHFLCCAGAEVDSGFPTAKP